MSNPADELQELENRADELMDDQVFQPLWREFITSQLTNFINDRIVEVRSTFLDNPFQPHDHLNALVNAALADENLTEAERLHLINLQTHIDRFMMELRATTVENQVARLAAIPVDAIVARAMAMDEGEAIEDPQPEAAASPNVAQQGLDDAPDTNQPGTSSC